MIVREIQVSSWLQDIMVIIELSSLMSEVLDTCLTAILIAFHVINLL